MKLRFLPFVYLLGALFGAAALSGADEPEKSDFFIPRGSKMRGDMAFMKQKCYSCHTLESRDLPDVDLPAKLKIHLGGAAHRLWTRDDYAKAILNPEHVVAPEYQAVMRTMGDEKGAQESPMPEFNETLTVAELIDLATFLAAGKD